MKPASLLKLQTHAWRLPIHHKGRGRSLCGRWVPVKRMANAPNCRVCLAVLAKEGA